MTYRPGKYNNNNNNKKLRWQEIQHCINIILEERESGSKRVFQEIIPENIPSEIKDINPQIQKAYMNKSHVWSTQIHAKIHHNKIESYPCPDSSVA